MCAWMLKKAAGFFTECIILQVLYLLQADDFLIILCPFAAEAVDLCRKKRKKKDKTEM